MSEDNELIISPKEELESLKAKADLMGITYHPSIGAEKLREKIRAALSDEPVEQAAAAVVEPVESAKQKRARILAEISKLVRIRVTCMNPAKKEWEGEIISAGNSIASFTKYVPFNADDGWHVPYFIYEVMRDRECQVFQTITDSRGNKTRKGRLIKEFAIEVLPQLTQEELQELAQRQAMSKSID
jgi:hypothetical protein